MKQISLCIPTYERPEMTVNAFKMVHDRPEIAEVIIVDDASCEDTYKTLELMCQFYPKVVLLRNQNNLDCFLNKRKTISFSSTDYAILLDSDNEIDNDYIDKIYEQQWEPKTFLMPSFAYPNFCYEEFEGLTVTKENVAAFMNRPLFRVMLNCANYFVHCETYLDAADISHNPNTADSIYVNYNHLRNGGKIKVVPGMSYNHLVHPNSHYATRNHLTGDFLNKIENNLRELI